MDNIYLENIQSILNSETTDEEKHNELLALIKSIRNDLLLGAEEKENLINQIENTDILLKSDIELLKKLRNRSKKFLITNSFIGLSVTGLSAGSIYKCIIDHKQIIDAMKNSFSSDILAEFTLGSLLFAGSLVAGIYDYLTYQELQEYMEYDKEINSYQRRLKDNHR